MTISELFAQRFWAPLILALAHTLWQGAALALGLRLALGAISVQHPQRRYRIALGAQVGTLLLGLATWSFLQAPMPAPASSRTQGSRNSPATDSPSPPALVSYQVKGTSPSPSFSPPNAPGAPGTISAPTTPPSDDNEPTPQRLIQLAAFCWVVGVVLMCGRTIRATLEGTRLARGPVVEHAGITTLIHDLARGLDIKPLPRLVNGPIELGPAVLGVLRPTIVLPVSYLSGMTPDHLRAILAHELAHIKHCDALWNQVQMLVEAALFFNPAIWWMGRQARVEREARCDADAVSLTGQPLEYSRALADWAERAGRIAPLRYALMVGWNGPERPSTLRERIARILSPNERPRPRLSVWGLGLLLVLGPVVLFALHRGTTITVVLAAQILAPAERVEQVRSLQKQFDPLAGKLPSGTRVTQVTLKGTIQTPNGQPVSKPVAAAILSRSDRSSGGGLIKPLGPSFSTKVSQVRELYLLIEPNDFAPAYVGPFNTSTGQDVEGITIKLDPGFPGQIHVKDEEGKPVPGAKIKGGLVINGMSHPSAEEWVTGDDGVAILPHASEQPYQFAVEVGGFQPFSQDKVTLKPNVPATLTLRHAKPVEGVVVDQKGKPVPGVQIKLFYVATERTASYSGAYAKTIAVTDEKGRFKLDTLEDRQIYGFLLESETLGRQIVERVKPGQVGLRWMMEHNRVLQGKITGDLGKVWRNGMKPELHVTQPVHLKKSSDYPPLQSEYPIGQQVEVEPSKEGGTFRISGLLPGPVTVSAGSHKVTLDTNQADQEVTIDLNESLPKPPPKILRNVVLKFRAPAGEPLPSGVVEVRTSPADRSSWGLPQTRPIESGRVQIEMPVPGMVQCEIRSLPGYWISNEPIDVEQGVGIKEVEIQAIPASAVIGQVLDHQGLPLSEGIHLRVDTIKRSPSLPPINPRPRTMTRTTLSKQLDSKGRMLFPSLPIGGTYMLVASVGQNYQISKPFTLDGTKASELIEIRMAQPASALGRVLGPDGKPVAELPITLKLNHPGFRGYLGASCFTDSEGRFQFEGLNPGFEYQARLDLRKTYQPTEVILQPGGDSTEIRLKPGLVLEGQLVDAASGQPIPRIEMYAAPIEQRPGQWREFGAEGRTDDQGRFRFSNLPSLPEMRLSDRAALKWQPPDVSHLFKPGQEQRFEVRVETPPWMQPNPKNPQAR